MAAVHPGALQKEEEEEDYVKSLVFKNISKKKYEFLPYICMHVCM